MSTLWIGVGGAIGTIARYRLDVWVQGRLGAAFPFGTLAVNLLGSFFLAFLTCVGSRSEVLSPHVRRVLATGVLGGFTTYSAFNQETLRFLQEGAWGLGAAHVAGTVLGCLAAGALGWLCGSALPVG